MSSDDERYLDSLLNSAQSNKNPGSALSRMSSKAKGEGNSLVSETGSGDLGELVSNSNGNEDLAEIGDLLNKLDSDEIIDEKMADLLDNIESPTDEDIPNFTVGKDVSALDTRDPEEIALDEAIADAERMEAEIQSGKFDDTSANPDENTPIVDISEEDDALSEMAPEVILPEDNAIAMESSNTSDADETPEEILTGLLDDMPGDDLSAAADEAQGDSLSDVLDNIQDLSEGDSDSLDNLSLEDIEKSIDAIGNEEQVLDQIEEPIVEPEQDETTAHQETSEGEMENLDDLMKDMADLDSLTEDSSMGAADTSDSSLEEKQDEDGPSDSSEESTSDEVSLEEMEQMMDNVLEKTTSEDGTADEPASEIESLEESLTDEMSSEDGASEAELSEETSSDEISLETTDETTSEDSSDGKETTQDADSPESAESSEDEFDLGNLEASLDDLLGEDADSASSTEGEVAELADSSNEGADQGAEGEDVSMPDLDALMNSLASDEIEDLESTAKQDEEAGVAQDEEIPKEEILEALTEEGFDDGAEEPSLDDLASIPEKGESKEEDSEDDKGGKGKKEKKEKKGLAGFFANLFKTLTEEENEGLASLTDENATVLEELAGEEKPKKEKKKKEKKPKKEKPKKEPKPKKEKPPKPKKEKKPKPPKDPEAPEKVMSPKKIAISGIFAASIGIFFMIPVLVLPERIANNKASSAYTHREYTTAYKMLYGKELTEDQSIIYEQSRVLAWAQRYLSGYENYVAMNMKEEALDMLLMGMRNKEDLLEEATKFNVEFEVQGVYSNIESLLLEKYGLSETDISDINSIKKERDYTIRLMEIVGTL